MGDVSGAGAGTSGGTGSCVAVEPGAGEVGFAGGFSVTPVPQFGANLLQQRFIFRLTRHEVPTYLLQEVSAHVFEEADLLEEWSDTVCAAGMSQGQAAASFEAFIRGDRGGGKRLQGDLRDPQRRSSVRTACRTEATRVATRFAGGG